MRESDGGEGDDSVSVSSFRTAPAETMYQRRYSKVSSATSRATEHRDWGEMSAPTSNPRLRVDTVTMDAPVERDSTTGNYIFYQ